MSRLVVALLALAALPLAAQPSDADRARGYVEEDGTATFVFDPALYGFSPAKVAVTGPFRGWSSDDDDPDWALQQTGDVWTLVLEDAQAAGLGPATPFKFRGDGRWLDPPLGLENVAGGNLVYRFGEAVPRLIAEIRGSSSIAVTVEGEAEPLSLLSGGGYQVVRWDGFGVPVSIAIPNEATTALLWLGLPLDPAQVHYVEVETDAGLLRARARFDGLWRDLVDPDPMGATVEETSSSDHQNRTASDGSTLRVRPRPGTQTTFRLFAPRADSVSLGLYSERTGPGREVAMTRTETGVWTAVFEGDLHGTWYDFAVYGPGGPGSAFTNQTGERVSDPYALVSDDSWGRSRVWRDAFEAPRPVEGGRPAMEDVVAYEVHVQD
ncbi:MAG: hypothetical protein WBA11_12530, partial [Rubrivirga sp.]